MTRKFIRIAVLSIIAHVRGPARNLPAPNFGAAHSRFFLFLVRKSPIAEMSTRTATESMSPRVFTWVAPNFGAAHS